MPMNVGKLSNLQVLSSFYLDKGSEFNIQQLQELNLHGELSIFNMQNIVNPSDAQTANLKNKVHLVKLNLEWNGNSDDSEKEREVLEKLQPSKHLKELSIQNYGGTRFSHWFGDDSLSNVVSLKLSNCENCVLLPSLGILSSLKELFVIGLSGIIVIGSEFYGNVCSAPSVIIPFASLQTLQFQNMKGWQEWECKATGAFPCLKHLLIEDCPNLKECLPKQLPSLIRLKLLNCKQLVASVSQAPSINQLDLIHCGKLQFDNQPSTLRFLQIVGSCIEGSLLECDSLESLVIVDFPIMNVPLHCCYKFLISLSLINTCDFLRIFPLNFFPKLKSLRLQKCSNLETISHDNDHSRLEYLEIIQCPKIVSFLMGRFSVPNLQWITINKLENLKSFPECMHTLFPSLTSLIIKYCPQLELFSDGGLPSSLEYLCVIGCSKLLIASLKWAWGIHTSLEELHIKKVDVESFPDQGLHPLSVKTLFISSCRNLKNLDYKGLCHLSCLEVLSISGCPSLQCLPMEGLPKSISTLDISNCPLLTERCKKPDGEDWGKISHIESVEIDEVMII